MLVGLRRSLASVRPKTPQVLDSTGCTADFKWRRSPPRPCRPRSAGRCGCAPSARWPSATTRSRCPTSPSSPTRCATTRSATRHPDCALLVVKARGGVAVPRPHRQAADLRPARDRRVLDRRAARESRRSAPRPRRGPVPDGDGARARRRSDADRRAEGALVLFLGQENRSLRVARYRLRGETRRVYQVTPYVPVFLWHSTHRISQLPRVSDPPELTAVRWCACQ